MGELLFFNLPTYATLKEYDGAIAEMVNLLSRQDAVKAIFQVGGISSPGTSDIDFFVLFKDQSKCSYDPLRGISASAARFITHGLFGTSERFLEEIEPFTIFGKYRHLWGAPLSPPAGNTDDAVKHQIALEYLLKMYITLSIERAYGICNVRNFLLMAKAIKLDLDLLGIKEGELCNLTSKAIAMRSDWFSAMPSKADLRIFMNAYYTALEGELKNILKRHRLFLPRNASLRISKNITLASSAELASNPSGLKIPAFVGLPILGKKFPRTMNRLMSFQFTAPYAQTGIPSAVERRFSFLKEAKTYNREHLPHFLPTGYALNIV